MTWMTAAQALAALGTKPQTLYANVSRGRISARPDPADSRRSLYNAEDVARLAARSSGRRSTEVLAAQTIRWGDPILQSAISTVLDGRLRYRGHDAVHLAEAGTLEAVAAILWDGPLPLSISARPVQTEPPSLRRAFLALADRAGLDLPSLGRNSTVLQRDAGSVLATLTTALVGDSQAPALHLLAAHSWNRPDASDIIRRALVLLADHELNASTFAARVAGSTGASLAAAVLAGLATVTGPLHGGASHALSGLIAQAQVQGPEQVVREFLRQGRTLPGFGHELYPQGDVRAAALLAQLELSPSLSELRRIVEDLAGEQPNVDFALAAMTEAHALPRDAPIILFALARSVGWLAHAMEQVTSGTLIRPRARYVGPSTPA